MGNEYISKAKIESGKFQPLPYPHITPYDANVDSYERGWNDAIDAILGIPAADVVEVRRGQWISDGAGNRFGTVVRLDKDGCPVDTCHCSECGEWLTASDEYPVIGRYCPNCGAKMEGWHDDD